MRSERDVEKNETWDSLSISDLPDLSNFNLMSVWRDDIYDCQLSLFIKWQYHFFVSRVKIQLFFLALWHVDSSTRTISSNFDVQRTLQLNNRTEYVFSKYTSNIC